MVLSPHGFGHGQVSTGGFQVSHASWGGCLGRIGSVALNPGSVGEWGRNSLLVTSSTNTGWGR